jgi:hypothetical protein
MTTELTTTTATPMSLLALAIERDADPDRLRQLMDLQERWEANQAKRAFAEAMHGCQLEMPSVVRGGVNPKTQSKFAKLEGVQAVAKPVYSSHGFSLSYGEADCPTKEFKRTVCDVRHSGGHCERYHLDLPIDGIGPQGNAIGGMNKVQGCISTTSYGQRRLLCMIFNITLSDEDDDGNGAAEVITEQQVDILSDWIEKTGTNRATFLKWVGVESLAQFPADRYADAIQQMERKASKARAGA